MKRYAFVTYMVAVEDDGEIGRLPIPRGAHSSIDVICNPDSDHRRIAPDSFDEIGRAISRSLASDVRRRGYPLPCHSNEPPPYLSYPDTLGEPTQGDSEEHFKLPKWVPLGGIVHIRDHDVILPVDRVLDDPKRGNMIGAALFNDFSAVQRYYSGFSGLPKFEAVGRALGILSTAIMELEKSRSPIN